MNKFIDLTDITDKYELSVIIEAKIDNKNICKALGIENNQPYSFGIHIPYSISLTTNVNASKILLGKLEEITKRKEQYKISIISIQNVIKN